MELFFRIKVCDPTRLPGRSQAPVDIQLHSVYEFIDPVRESKPVLKGGLKVCDHRLPGKSQAPVDIQLHSVDKFRDPVREL
jgi:hypothetical protein